MQNSTLYYRLGQKSGIEMAVGHLVGLLIADRRIKGYFAHLARNTSRRAEFEGKLVGFICEATGGLQEYKGQPMVRAHQSMRIKQDQFEAVLELVGITLDHFNARSQEKQEVLALLAPLRSEIVGQ